MKIKLENIQPRVLIVDDEELIGELLSDYLKEKGFEPFSIVSGEEAVKYVKRLRPHVVLLDIRIPDMNGLDVLQQIHELDPTVAVIMITGMHDEETARQALKLGAVDYIAKPIDLEYLDTSLMIKISSMLND
ncbi:MAG: response regulator [Calditrichaeota bacterium]|nr:response regulator [Calditrichota bacterium]